MKIKRITTILVVLATMVTTAQAQAQQFDFTKLRRQVSKYTVILDMTIEVSFGMNSSEEQEKLLGTIVTKDGLIMFNGALLIGENAGSMHGLTVKTLPTKVTVNTLNGDSYDATYIGVDRFTRIGFVKIDSTENAQFEPVQFVDNAQFKVGDWLALYMLMPDFVEPPLAADVGMVSSLIDSPEQMPLMVGFSTMQMTSVLFDENLKPVGVLGLVMDPTSAGIDASGMLESMGQFGMPILGVVTSEKLNKLIADPPRRGSVDRGWLGISLQALTTDLAKFLGLDSKGGIIVNDVVANSPAAKAGIKTGDIILSVNGQPVEVDREDKIPMFQRSIAEMGPGASVELTIFHPDKNGGGTQSNVLVQLEPTPMSAADAPEYESKSLEFKAREMVFSDYMALNLDRDQFKGMVVSEMKPGGLANVGGLELGDIIQKIDSRPVSTKEEMEKVMTDIEQKKPKEVIFFIWRDNKTVFVNVKTDWQ